MCEDCQTAEDKAKAYIDELAAVAILGALKPESDVYRLAQKSYDMHCGDLGKMLDDRETYVKEFDKIRAWLIMASRVASSRHSREWLASRLCAALAMNAEAVELIDEQAKLIVALQSGEAQTEKDEEKVEAEV